MNTENRHILIIDDEEAILFAFKDILSEPLLTIDTAQSLEEARLHLSGASYRGAIIDLRLGGSNGYEGFNAIHMIKENNPYCKILLLTAYAKPGTREQALFEGADFFMEKPVSPEEIRVLFKANGIL